MVLCLACVLAACGGDDNNESADNAGGEGETESAGVEENEEDEDSEFASVEAGEEVFQNNCAGCHGQDLTGGGPDLTEIGSKYSQNEIADIVENGTDGGMPAFGNLEGDDLDELTKWLSEHK